MNENKENKGLTMDTMEIKKEKISLNEVRMTLNEVYAALKEKGYNPTSQLLGYIMSGDPTYITSHNNARTLITKVDRDELVEELINFYIENFIGDNMKKEDK